MRRIVFAVLMIALALSLLGSLFLAFALLNSAGAKAQERVVNIYNWSDYIDPKSLEAFTKETGIKVVYDTYDNNEILETKLLAGQSGYDLVVPTGPFLQRLIKAGVFRPLDKAKIPNLKHAWPEIAQRLAVYDPGNTYAVDYMWGTTGIGVNLGPVRERLGPNQPLNTWTLVLNPGLMAKLKDCGVMMLDSPEDLIPSMLPAYGLKPDTKRWDDISQVTDALFKVRGSVRKFHSSEYINGLANGDLCLAVGYSGDVMQAKKRAEESKNGVEIAYFIPKEGALMWFDAFAIPKDAPPPRGSPRLHRLHDAPGGGGGQHQLRRLCQRQPRRQTPGEAGDPHQPRHLPGRRDDAAALHQPGLG